MSNEIYAIHFEGQLLQPDIWKQYSDKYGATGANLQGWKPPKRFYYKLHHAKNGLRHLPYQIQDKCEIVKYTCEYDTYVEGYRDGMRGDDPRLWSEEEDGIGS